MINRDMKAGSIWLPYYELCCLCVYILRYAIVLEWGIIVPKEFPKIRLNKQFSPFVLQKSLNSD